MSPVLECFETQIWWKTLPDDSCCVWGHSCFQEFDEGGLATFVNCVGHLDFECSRLSVVVVAQLNIRPSSGLAADPVAFHEDFILQFEPIGWGDGELVLDVFFDALALAETQEKVVDLGELRLAHGRGRIGREIRLRGSNRVRPRAGRRRRCSKRRTERRALAVAGDGHSRVHGGVSRGGSANLRYIVGGAMRTSRNSA